MIKSASFVKERNEALFSLDRERIERYVASRGCNEPVDDIVFWGGVYKAILCIPNAPVDVVEKALTWLEEHGMQPTINFPCIYQRSHN